MFIYNITIKVDWDIHEQWLEWFKTYHVPAILDYKCFYEAKLLKLHEIDESDGATYAVQFFAESKANYNRYIELYANEVSTIERNFWNMKVMTFGTLMQVVEENFNEHSE